MTISNLTVSTVNCVKLYVLDNVYRIIDIKNGSVHKRARSLAFLLLFPQK